ncbi:TCPQ [Hepatospora eriocheir]|uniref:TCPQ n=1 Tax=Hepatospora eriocheir TaxID=1081669 RepID=A0A1X0QKV8_9MICR|nr:TCPQ [Hepatospora eriocheir]
MNNIINKMNMRKTKTMVVLNKLSALLEIKGDYKLIVSNDLMITRDNTLIYENVKFNHPILLIFREYLNKVKMCGSGSDYFIELLKKLIGEFVYLIENGMSGKKLSEELSKIKVKSIGDGISLFNDNKKMFSFINSIVNNDRLSKLVTNVILSIDKDNLDKIRVIKIPIGPFDDSYVVNGLVIPNNVSGTTNRIFNTTVSLFNCQIDLPRPEASGKAVFRNADDLLAYNKDEYAIIKDFVDRLTINALIVSGKVNDVFLDLLDNRHILVLRVFNKYDLKIINDVVGGKILNNFYNSLDITKKYSEIEDKIIIKNESIELSKENEYSETTECNGLKLSNSKTSQDDVTITHNDNVTNNEVDNTNDQINNITNDQINNVINEDVDNTNDKIDINNEENNNTTNDQINNTTNDQINDITNEDIDNINDKIDNNINDENDNTKEDVIHNITINENNNEEETDIINEETIDIINEEETDIINDETTDIVNDETIDSKNDLTSSSESKISELELKNQLDEITIYSKPDKNSLYGCCSEISTFKEGDLYFTKIIGSEIVKTIVIKHPIKSILDEYENSINRVLECINDKVKFYRELLSNSEITISEDTFISKYVIKAINDLNDEFVLFDYDRVKCIRLALEFMEKVLEIDDYLVAVEMDKLRINKPKGHWDDE